METRIMALIIILLILWFMFTPKGKEFIVTFASSFTTTPPAGE